MSQLRVLTTIALILACSAGCRKSSSDADRKSPAPAQAASATRAIAKDAGPKDAGPSDAAPSDAAPSRTSDFKPEACVRAEIWEALERAQEDDGELPYEVVLTARKADGANDDKASCPSSWQVRHVDRDAPDASEDAGQVCVRSVTAVALRPDRIVCLLEAEDQADADADADQVYGSFIVAALVQVRDVWRVHGIRSIDFEKSDGARGVVSWTASIAPVAITPSEDAILFKVAEDRFILGDTTVATQEELLRVGDRGLVRLVHTSSETYARADDPDPQPNEGHYLWISKDLHHGYYDVVEVGVDTGTDDAEPAPEIRHRWNGRVYERVKR